MKKLLIPTLALILLCATIFCIGAAAEGSEPYANIPGHNLALEDSIHIIYYVDFQNVPAGAEKGVLIWTSPQSSYTYGTQNAKLTKSTGVYSSYLKYEFTDVAAKMMAQDIYAVAYIKDGNKITYSALDKYSVLQYAYNKKSSSGLGALLTKMLNYGAEAQTYFNYKTDRMANGTYYQITVEGGTLTDGSTKGLYPAGAEVILTANAPEEGKQFANWTNAAGEAVGTEENLTVTVTAAETYTANYEDIPAEPLTYSEGLVYTSRGDGTCYVSGIGTCTDTDIVIPPTSPANESVTSIGSSAFDNCRSLTSITIPDSVTNIQDRAFYWCSGLESVTIGKSVRSIGEHAFYNCNKLSSVYYTGDLAGWCGIGFSRYGGNPVQYAHYLYIDGQLLTEAIIPEGITQIRNDAFTNCRSLTSITVPSSLTSIASQAFYNCVHLIEVHNLSAMTITPGTTATGCISFYAKHVYRDGESYLHTTEDGYIFYEDKNEVWLVLYQGSLTDLVLPADYNGKSYGIYKYAFYDCKHLKSVILPDSVTSIGDEAFGACSGLVSVTIGSGVTSIGANPWSGCSSLESISGGSSDYRVIQNCLIETKTGKLVSGCKNSDIPTDGSVTSIGKYSFSGCTDLTDMTIPDSVTSIGERAFFNCVNLESMTVPFVGEKKNATSNFFGYIFGAPTFSDNVSFVPSSLKSVVITGGSVIGTYAFYKCAGLTDVTIPESVTCIEQYAFSACNALKNIVFQNTSGWYVTQTKGATSGINVTVTDNALNLYNLKSRYYSYFWYRQ